MDEGGVQFPSGPQFPFGNCLDKIHSPWHIRDMENETTKSNSKVMPIMIVAAIVVIVAVAAIAFTMSKKPEAMQEQTAVPTQPQEAMEVQPTDAMIAAYADGEYEAEGMYTSPGGAESIDVTLTLKGGIVEDAEVVSNATRPISKQMQASFIGGFKEQVVGKRIDEINLTKVSASSLTPKGFNDAIEKIKAQAQS